MTPKRSSINISQQAFRTDIVRRGWKHSYGAGAVASGAIPSKTRVFISYSRKDMAFADRLEAALKERGFDVFIDV